MFLRLVRCAAAALVVGLFTAGCGGSPEQQSRVFTRRIRLVETDGHRFILFYDGNNSAMESTTAPAGATVTAVSLAREGPVGTFALVAAGDDEFLLFYDGNNSAMVRLPVKTAEPPPIVRMVPQPVSGAGSLYRIEFGAVKTLLFYDGNNSTMRLVTDR